MCGDRHILGSAGAPPARIGASPMRSVRITPAILRGCSESDLLVRKLSARAPKVAGEAPALPRQGCRHA